VTMESVGCADSNDENGYSVLKLCFFVKGENVTNGLRTLFQSP
jgi:hypothetical protein